MRKNTKRNTSNRKARKSLKGEWGHIGAPPKPMRWPGRPFVMAALFAFNPTLCELTVRKNVDKALEAGTLVELVPLPQKGGAVGRPKSRFVLKSKFDAAKMTLRPAKATVTATPAPSVTVTATPAPVVPTPAPVVETVAVEAPAVPLPATEVAPIVEIPASPAIEAPVAPLSETPATPAAPVTETPVVS